MTRLSSYMIGSMLGMLGVIIGGGISQASADSAPAPSSLIRPAIVCPSTIETMLPMLLRDLPSYANRVSTRAQVRDRAFNPRGVVITAAQPEISSLDMDVHAMIPSEEAIASNGLTPLFFTTLERHYRHGTATRIQHYHWAFLTRTSAQEWGLALMFSRIGDYPAQQPVSPPRESRQGTIGQGIQLWLRDCNAGAVDAL
ncbi:MAG: hypothetical protein F6K30_28445 [Cyanothece sp. SIO2G6]|nr:hypothetical protein [Cyanothece sp. SIO2G6]